MIRLGGGHGSGGDGSGGHGAGPATGRPVGPGTARRRRDKVAADGGNGTGGDNPYRGDRSPDTPLGNKAGTQEHFNYSLAQGLVRNNLTEAKFIELIDTPLDQLSLDDSGACETSATRSPGSPPTPCCRR